MQQASKSAISFLPLVLFVIVPIFAFVAFKGYGIFVFALFFNPIFNFIGQFFKTYKIQDNLFIINGLFYHKEIPIASIQSVEKKNSSTIQKFWSGFPEVYVELNFNEYDQVKITPAKDLIFNAQNQQLYFKN